LSAAKYPELKVFDEPADFLSAEDRRSIRSELHFDIDDPPARVRRWLA